MRAFLPKKLGHLAVAFAVTASLFPMATSASASIQDDSIGFTKQWISAENTVLLPGQTRLLGHPNSSSPGFGRVKGFPDDMLLLVTVRLSGPVGTTMGVRQWTPSFTATDQVIDQDSPNSTRRANNQRVLATLAPGITSWRNVTELAFTATQASVNDVLSLLEVTAGIAQGQVSIDVAVTRDEGAAYNIANNHFYRFIDWASPNSPNYIANGSQRTWSLALAEAASVTLKGVTGHLATITSESENTFVRDRLGNAQNVFLAGSDKDREGQWKWYAGPENGQVFWEARCAADNTCNGDAAYIDRTPAINTFSAWATSATAPDDPNNNEPNDWGAGAANDEDYLVTNRFVSNLADGVAQDPRWNDLPSAGSFVGGYVVEFSGLLTDFSGVYTRSVSFYVRPVEPQLRLKRTQDNKVEIAAAIAGISEGQVVLIQRRNAKGRMVTIARKTISERELPRLSRTFYTDSQPGPRTADVIYRLVIERTTQVPFQIGSVLHMVQGLKPEAPKVRTDLRFKVGQHIANVSNSLFKAFGLRPRSPFKITLRSEPVVLFDGKADENGAVVLSLRIPESTEAGAHTVTVEGTGSDGKKISTVANFTLDDEGFITMVADSESNDGILPATGLGASPLMLFATASLLLGGAFLVLRRRVLLL